MKVTWYHYYIPKVFSTASFLVNPIFVYLVFTGKSKKLGNYRFLLLYFATFNVTYSVFDLLVPVGIHTYRYSFTVFINDGLFFKYSEFHFIMLAARCSLVSCSYAVLISHFLYRYLIVKKPELLKHHFLRFMLSSFILCILYFMIWYKVGEGLGYLDQEKEEYLHEHFKSYYNVNVDDLNIIVALFNEATPKTVMTTWFGVGVLTVLSCISVTVFIVLGFLIMKTLRGVNMHMSQKTTKLQMDLLRALVVQTVIPLFVSFTPCFLSWYAPAFNIDLGSGINSFNSIAIAAFPWFDPVAIVLCLPVLRHRIF